MILSINFLPVQPCACGTGSPHWSIADMSRVLGRPITSADAIRVDHTVVPDPAKTSVHERSPACPVRPCVRAVHQLGTRHHDSMYVEFDDQGRRYYSRAWVEANRERFDCLVEGTDYVVED